MLWYGLLVVLTVVLVQEPWTWRMCCACGLLIGQMNGKSGRGGEKTFPMLQQGLMRWMIRVGGP